MDLVPKVIADASLPSPEPARRLMLELALAPDDARRLPLLLRGNGRRRAAALTLIWHDTPDFDLAADGLALMERRQGRKTAWRLERMVAEPGTLWSPGTPCPVLAEAADAVGLGAALPAQLAGVAGFEGRSRSLSAPDGVELTLLCGTLGAAGAARPCCRVVLAGPETAVAALAERLAGRLHLHVPATSLAAEAMAVAGRVAPARSRAAPALPPDRPVGETFAHLVAQLTTAILQEAERASPAECEPVHQMRVALRRLRSAFGLFGRAVRCPELAGCKDALRNLGRVLGPARDWDVFVAETGRTVAASFTGDPAVHGLLEAAEQRRQDAYAALLQHLDSAEFRRLGIALAILAANRPWETMLAAALRADGDAEAARQAERLARPLADFAARALERRLRPLRAPGTDIEALPAEALHQAAPARQTAALCLRVLRPAVPRPRRAAVHPPADRAAGAVGPSERRLRGSRADG